MTREELGNKERSESIQSHCFSRRVVLRMKSLAELSKELGMERLMEGEGGTDASSAGKVRRRSGGRQRSWVDIMAGRDYLGQ